MTSGQPQVQAAEPTAAHGDLHSRPQPCGSRRRRLWELPAQARELLLGLSLPPELLRSTVTRAIGRERGVRCRLQGSEVDVLFSTLHDLGTRNPLSEALHKLLEARHSVAVQRWSRCRDDEALRASWRAALSEAGDARAGAVVVPAAAALGLSVNSSADLSAGASVAAEPGRGVMDVFWAHLTHPHGPSLEDELLYDLRAWVYARMRQAQRGGDNRLMMQLQRDALALQLQRCRQAAAQAQALESARSQAEAQQTAQLRGELARCKAQLAALALRAAADPRTGANAAPEASAQCAKSAQSAQCAPAPACRPALRAKATFSSAATASLKILPSVLTASQVSADAQASAGGPSPDIAGLKILCVGGAQASVSRYRAIVESRGARFVHHDGGIEDGAHRLQAQLVAADLVICQAGCINHEAYRRIKRHCKRDNKPCRYLQRPSLSQFAACLGAGPWREL